MRGIVGDVIIKNIKLSRIQGLLIENYDNKKDLKLNNLLENYALLKEQTNKENIT